MLADGGQIDEAVDRSEQVVRRHMPLQAEAIEQLLLHHTLLAHHRLNLLLQRRLKKIESVLQDCCNPDFFNII
ncbi:hypothetical protein NKG95_33915, partial [Mesorhizobium sp. M1423]|uniref:hypothetical protein n=1 Tax=Mesorhizobium sp. M1423 TaxID=2957101 RepID=UPI00333635A0